MDFLRLIVGIHNLSSSSLGLLFGSIFLITFIAIWYRQRLNFFTLLACNTCISSIIFLSNTLSMTVYMLIWDQNTIKMKSDFLCIVRGQLNYVSITAVYHSYVLQTLYRYWRVKRITKFDSIYFRLLFIVIQWIIAIILPLPVIFSGDLNQVSSGLICAISIFNIWLLIYISAAVYFIPLVIIMFLYRQVIIHVKQSGATALARLKLDREVTVIRRIILIVIVLILSGLPFMVFMVISFFNPAIIPDYYLHLVYISVLFSTFVQMIMLIRYTPSVKKTLIELKNKHLTQNNRVFTITQNRTNEI